jgi:cell division protein ZapA
MAKQPVQVSVAGHTYRMVTTLDATTLTRLASQVEKRLGQMAPGQQIHPQALLLVALSLAHDLEQAADRQEALTRRSREVLQQMLQRVDAALGNVDENAEELSVSTELTHP